MGCLVGRTSISSAFAEQAKGYGIANADQLAGIAEGWLDWAKTPDAVFIAVHGEIIGRLSA